jgi:hypothetical protein
MDYIPQCPYSWYVIQLHDRIVQVREEFMLEAGAIKGGTGRPWRSAAYHYGDVVWFDFMTPLRHLVVDVTVTSARTNTNIPRIGARLPLPGSLALEARHGKVDADLCTSALLVAPSVMSVHDNYPFALEDGGGRLVPMAVELVDRLAILVACLRFINGMGVVDSCSLRSES